MAFVAPPSGQAILPAARGGELVAGMLLGSVVSKMATLDNRLIFTMVLTANRGWRCIHLDMCGCEVDQTPKG